MGVALVVEGAAGAVGVRVAAAFAAARVSVAAAFAALVAAAVSAVAAAVVVVASAVVVVPGVAADSADSNGLNDVFGDPPYDPLTGRTEDFR